jgi:Holliday junction DNA helicase RuvB
MSTPFGRDPNRTFEQRTAEILREWGVQPDAAEVRVEAPSSPPPDYPRSFAEFIGQPEAVRLLRTEVEAAKRDGRPLAHLLFYGAPGLGKSAVAYVLAGEMGYAIYESSGAEFPTQDTMLQACRNIGDLYARSGRPILWLIDEVDGMGRPASYVIHSLMTHGYVTWQGQQYGGVPIVFVGTTNRTASVPGALKSRFAEHIRLDFYAPAELALIAQQSAARMGMTLTDEAAAWIGENSGGEPRKTNRRILRNVRNLLSEASATADLETVRKALELSGLHAEGLATPQVEYLRYLDSVSGTAGLASIAAYLGTDPKDLQFSEEPFLIRTGYVMVTRSGRQLTQRGTDYLLRIGHGARD